LGNSEEVLWLRGLVLLSSGRERDNEIETELKARRWTKIAALC
jgi:hypothetical protein